MVRFNDKMKQERPGFPPPKMRIGIHTGPVVVGTLGNDLRVEFKAVGDTVNLASRMESLAEAGATYVTGDTFKLTEGLFQFEGLGKKEIKGKLESIDVYRVLSRAKSKS
jgi:class 3 adenylate cyclase